MAIATITKAYTLTMASAGTLTGATDLGQVYRYMYLHTPSGNSGVTAYVHGSSDNSTFARVQAVSTTTVADYQTTASAGKISPIPAGLQYYKIETQGALDNGGTFVLIGSNTDK